MEAAIVAFGLLGAMFFVALGLGAVMSYLDWRRHNEYMASTRQRRQHDRINR